MDLHFLLQVLGTGGHRRDKVQDRMPASVLRWCDRSDRDTASPARPGF